ncbi:carbon-nitrogen hydrolase [Geopyxis carbonaria]|nr:carbon-nitrogen hydrolase [Geopyxis carbonaria]
MSTVRVAITQHEPGWFDLQASVAKTIALIAEAAAGGADLIAFPECWIPGYPLWIWKYPVRPDLAARYHKAALSVSSPEFQSILAAAAASSITVVLGFAERAGSTLYMSQAIISATGTLLLSRRKVKPTHMERTIFGDAQGGDTTLTNCVETNGKAGRVAALNCWEHLQPLLKYHSIAQGPQVHVAAWPPITPVKEGELYSLSKEGCKALSQVYAMESQSFVLHTGSVITALGVAANQTEGAPMMSTPSGGSSCVFGPDGRPIEASSKALADDEEGMVYADLDLDAILVSKGFCDPVGHYSRPDLLRLVVDKGTKACVESFEGESK